MCCQDAQASASGASGSASVGVWLLNIIINVMTGIVQVERRAGFQLLLGPGTSGADVTLLGHRRRDKHAEIDDGCAARAPHPPCAHPIHPSSPTHRSRTLSPPSTAHVPLSTPRLPLALLLLCAQEL